MLVLPSGEKLRATQALSTHQRTHPMPFPDLLGSALAPAKKVGTALGYQPLPAAVLPGHSTIFFALTPINWF